MQTKFMEPVRRKSSRYNSACAGYKAFFSRLSLHGSGARAFEAIIASTLVDTRSGEWSLAICLELG
jgi:hypothetical protein